jgi:hypothetical protein
MRKMVWLAGLVFAASSSAALAAAPSYDFIQLDYVALHPSSDDDSDEVDYQGVDFHVSGLIAPYLIFSASYEYLESDTFDLPPPSGEGRYETQAARGGLAGRLPLIRNVLEGTLGANFIYADVRSRGDLPEDGEYDTGFEVKTTLRANFRYFEVIPSVRYIDIFEEEDWGIGAQFLGCAGYGICGTAGYEYFKNAEAHKWFAGLRFYYN